MPFVWPHDAGTEFRKQIGQGGPGLDLGWYLHRGGAKHWEHYFYEVQNYTRRTNKSMLDVGGTMPFNAWSPGMPNSSWIDNTIRHQTIEGFYWKLHARDQLTQSCYELPTALHFWLDPTYEPPIIDAQEKVSRLKTPPEVALEMDQAESDEQFVRAWLQNETQFTGFWGGYTHLKDPIACSITNSSNNNMLFELDDIQLLFAPQDWRHPEWYKCYNKNGEVLYPTEEWLCLRPGGKYRVHMRPRLWRWTVFVLAHYAFISIFGIIPNDEYFTHVFFDRPPFYPWRHDVIHTKASQGFWNWNNDPRSYDPALDYHWEHTNAAADLSHQIIEQQYSSPSLVYLFLDNEDPDLFVEAWPSYEGDYVAVIERIDEDTDTNSLVFVKQARNLDSEYTKRQFGAFIARWQVVNTRMFGSPSV